MRVVAGCIAPPGLAERFSQAASRFSDIDLIPLVFHRDSEIPDLMRQARTDIDVMIFTGPVPYYVGKPYLLEGQPFATLWYTSRELYRGIGEVALQDASELNSLSIDTIPRSIVEEVFSELRLSTDGILSFEYHDASTSSADLAQAHQRAFGQGQVRRCFTSRLATYRALQDVAIPVTLVWPVTESIHRVLELALMEVRSARNRAAQVAVAILTFGDQRGNRLILPSDYSEQLRRLTITRELMDFGRRIEASVVPLGSDGVLLFTTRAGLESGLAARWEEGLHRLLGSDGEKALTGGFGLGHTARAAEAHARVALRRALEHGGGRAFMADEDGKVSGPLGSRHTTTFTTRSDDAAVTDLIRRTGLAVTTVTTLIELDRTARGGVTVDRLADYMNITTRRARKILQILQGAGIAHPVGWEQPYPKGRPRQLFRLSLADHAGHTSPGEASLEKGGKNA